MIIMADMSFDKKEAADIGQFVQFAYEMFDEGGLQPPPVQGIADAGYGLIYYLNATDSLFPDFKEEKRFYGYIAAAKDNPGDVILAIRGTRGAQEWLLDFLALPVPFSPAPKKGLVALGFLSIFNSFECVDLAGRTTTLKGAITQLNATNQIEAVTVIGHSLGSALATLAAAELAFLNVAGVKNKVTLYPFASPRVGLLNFARSFDKAVPSCVRIWNVLDIVPQVPPFPYIHVSGSGEPIVQTLEQLQRLAVNPRCEHILPDYLWLLDADDFAIDRRCSLQPSPQVVAGARALKKSMTMASFGTGVRVAQIASSTRSKKRSSNRLLKISSRKYPKGE